MKTLNKYLLVTLLSLGCCVQLKAQFDAHFSHYWALQSYFNPASIGAAGRLNITGTYSSQMSGFTRSASRRMDAELCLLEMCQPELSLDAKALNARLTRLEEQIKSGAFVAAAPAASAKKQAESEGKWSLLTRWSITLTPYRYYRVS